MRSRCGTSAAGASSMPPAAKAMARALLASAAREVVGVDISAETVAHANAHLRRCRQRAVRAGLGHGVAARRRQRRCGGVVRDHRAPAAGRPAAHARRVRAGARRRRHPRAVVAEPARDTAMPATTAIRFTCTSSIATISARCSTRRFPRASGITRRRCSRPRCGETRAAMRPRPGWAMAAAPARQSRPRRCTTSSSPPSMRTRSRLRDPRLSIFHDREESELQRRRARARGGAAARPRCCRSATRSWRSRGTDARPGGADRLSRAHHRRARCAAGGHRPLRAAGSRGSARGRPRRRARERVRHWSASSTHRGPSGPPSRSGSRCRGESERAPSARSPRRSASSTYRQSAALVAAAAMAAPAHLVAVPDRAIGEPCSADARIDGHKAAMAPRRRAVDIVVPVYNAPDDVAACVESVLAHTTPSYRLVLIDDASPDPARRDATSPRSAPGRCRRSRSCATSATSASPARPTAA